MSLPTKAKPETPRPASIGIVVRKWPQSEVLSPGQSAA
jgi:hypothetical protein